MKHARLAIIAITAAMLQACAAYHSVPPAGYSSSVDGAIDKIVFDQAGDPYPRSDDPSGLPIPQQPPNKNRAFTLKTHYAQLGRPYDRRQILDDMARRITDGMHAAGADRVVFLIKGFNNSFQRSDAEYRWIRNDIIGPRQAKGLYFVQVYWDSLYRGKGTAPAPLAYFADSMTYSNHAGDCGLRAVLRRLPAGTDVTFLTHSRGAAVALAAVSDAKYDPGITNDCQSSEPGHALPTQLGDVRLVAYAPAIGDGHLRDGAALKPSLFTVLDRFYPGFNPNDPAVTKAIALGIKIPARMAGDTRFGGSPSYVEHIRQLATSAGKGNALQPSPFSRKSHDWAEYMALTENADCMLWAGKLISAPTGACSLIP